MNSLNSINENSFISQWTRFFKRSPSQANKVHESDSELIKLPDGKDRFLAVTIDTVSEEIKAGVYKDPWLIGWISFMGALSDIAAVGADPVGVLVSITMPSGANKGYYEKIAKGMASASEKSEVFILGGDTNFGAETSVTICALGMVSEKEAMTRKGADVGDVLFATGKFGAGNALGFARMKGHPAAALFEDNFRPVAKLKQSALIRKFATTCMDTSDGLLAAMDQLSRINECGFKLLWNEQDILEHGALDLCRKAGLPGWLMLAGPLGEYELVFTIPESRLNEFTDQSKESGFIRIARTIKENEIILENPAASIILNTRLIRNAMNDPGDDFEKGIRQILKENKGWRYAR